MRRIYIVVPKKLRTTPPVKVTCGFAHAQVHHATVKACKRFKLSHLCAVIVMQVPNTASLNKLAVDLIQAGIKYESYWETSDRFKGKALTALVTNIQPGRMKEFDGLKLWACE